jgi:ParG
MVIALYDLFMPDNKTDDRSTVSFRVFCSEALRTEFKVYCAKEQTNMSEKCRELMENWIKEKQRQEKAS